MAQDETKYIYDPEQEKEIYRSPTMGYSLFLVLDYLKIAKS